MSSGLEDERCPASVVRQVAWRQNYIQRHGYVYFPSERPLSRVKICLLSGWQNSVHQWYVRCPGCRTLYCDTVMFSGLDKEIVRASVVSLVAWRKNFVLLPGHWTYPS
ncbi:hypothetical protein TNCV_4516131 [Trichonephila clavipes]|nr:hypothetical protein TNCV_4516131 [Trichonephila clavipes]